MNYNGKKYTKDELIRQLKELAARLRKTPTSRQINADKTVASATTFVLYFGSYTAAYKAAGLKPSRTTRYTKDELILQLKLKAKELDNKTPTVKHINADNAMASANTFASHFGSYPAACKAAGLKPNRTIGYTKGQLIRQLKKKAAKLGKTPTPKQVNADNAMASATTFVLHFGSYTAAYEAAGLKPNTSRHTKDELLKQLLSKSKQLRRSPIYSDIEKDPSMASVRTFKHHFGSLENALAEIGRKPHRCLPRISSDTLIRQLQDKAIALEKTPTTRDVDADKSMASIRTFYRAFGSFSKAISAAGLPMNRKRQ
jgi:hypothetical protein